MGHIIGSARTPFSPLFPPPPPPPETAALHAAPPAGRYAISNPLRRERHLHLLTGHLPEPLRRVLLDGLRRPPLFAGEQTPLAVQSARRRRLSDGQVARAHLATLCALTLTELEVTRRLVEAPREALPLVTHHALLVAQGAELRRLYLVLVARLREAGAQATVQALLAEVG
jgi:hypothetical protein